MPVNNPFALVAGLQYVDGTPSSATSFTGTVAMGFNGTDIVGLRMDASDNLLVNVAAFSGTVSVVGTLTHNSAAPAANNVGALVAVASSAAPTYNAGDQVLLSTDLAGNLRVTVTGSFVANNNIEEWNSVALGSPSAYGTTPGAVNVIGVNAFITNTPAVTVSGTVAVTQSGTWTVQQGSAPWSMNLTQINGAALGSPTDWGTAPATTVEVQGVNAELFVGQNAVSATNPVPVSATAAANASGNPIFVETVSGSTTVVTGTVAVTQSTSPWVVSLTSTTITGTVAVTQSTSPWVVDGNLTNNNAAPAATLIGVLPAIAETAYTTVTYTTGDMVLPVTDLHGALNQDLQAVAGTALGATAVTAFGTAPAAANVPGVNASIYAGLTGLTAAAKGTQGTNALTVQDYKDSGRTYISIFADAVNSTVTEALVTFQYNKGGTVTAGVTEYTVTTGKTLRIQSISVAVTATGATVQSKLRVRSAATVTATSPIIWGRFQASNATLPGESTADFPDGLEIASAQSIGVSGIQLTGAAGNTQWTVNIIGFEY
jgi:hypothetical protein